MAIVDDTPGTTRDRLFGEAEWNGRVFHVVDTGGIDPTHGGKTPLSIGSADFIDDIRLQAQVAINEADVVLFVTDGQTGVTSSDLEVANILRRSQKKLPDGTFWPPIVVVVNKCESRETMDAASQFYELGLGEPIAISAIHGTSTGDLLDTLLSAFPEQLEQSVVRAGLNRRGWRGRLRGEGCARGEREKRNAKHQTDSRLHQSFLPDFSDGTAANAEGALRQLPQRPFDIRPGRLYQKKPGITSMTVPE